MSSEILLIVSIALMGVCATLIGALRAWLYRRFENEYDNLVSRLIQQCQDYITAIEADKRQKLKRLTHVAILMRTDDDLYDCLILFFTALFLLALHCAMLLLEIAPEIYNSILLLTIVRNASNIFVIGGLFFLCVAFYYSFVLIFRLRRL